MYLPLSLLIQLRVPPGVLDSLGQQRFHTNYFSFLLSQLLGGLLITVLRKLSFGRQGFDLFEHVSFAVTNRFLQQARLLLRVTEHLRRFLQLTLSQRRTPLTLLHLSATLSLNLSHLPCSALLFGLIFVRKPLHLVCCLLFNLFNMSFDTTLDELTSKSVKTIKLTLAVASPRHMGRQASNDFAHKQMRFKNLKHLMPPSVMQFLYCVLAFKPEPGCGF